MGNAFTPEEIRMFEALCAPAPMQLVVNPHTYAVLIEAEKRWKAEHEERMRHHDALTAKARRIRTEQNRQMTDLEIRWFWANAYGRKCEPRTVDRIPFPDER